MTGRKRQGSWQRRLSWLTAGLVLAVVGCGVYARWIEPHWLAVRTVRLSSGTPRLRVCHISDLHYTTGERAYAERICREIRTLRPDLVCFTGDLADSEPGIREALALLGQLGCPVYGVPGNHDTADSDLYRAAIAATGGEWLENQAVSRPGSRGMICGMAHRGPRPVAVSGPRPWILLVHTPQAVANLRDPSFDVILAGHSHGGQVRLPWFGALVLPYGVGRYDRGLYRTPAGPLHVSTGLGTFFLPMRFLCRPEITLVEL